MGLTVGRMYSQGDQSFSHVDLGSLAALNEQLAPLQAFTGKVVLYADRYARTSGADVASGACALAWLDAWAQAGALLQAGNPNSYFQRATFIAPLAVAFSLVHGLDTGDRGRRARIAGWLDGLGRDTLAHYDGLPDSDTLKLNNHHDWAIYAATAAAAAANDAGLLHQAANDFRTMVCAITPEGTLPQELRRAGKALNYHLYAAEPLIATAEIGARNGLPLYEACGGALHRLVAFATASLDDGSRIEALAGARQSFGEGGDAQPPKSLLAWIEIYDARFPGRATYAERLAQGRPWVNTALGGNVTALLHR